VRRKPYSVVLFDEVEKAHPEVFNVLLQVLDDGRLTDAQGRTVDFKNTVVIMTSNIGSTNLVEGLGEDGAIAPATRDAVMSQLRAQFRPEFLNRIDDVILFKPLTRPEIGRIVELLVDDVRGRLAQRSIGLELSEQARDRIADAGYDPVYGARPLKRTLQRELETRIGRAIIAGEIPDGSRVRVVVRDGELALDVVEAPSGTGVEEPVEAVG